MNSPFTMVVVIVAIVMIASVLMKRMELQHKRAQRDPREDEENLRLRHEVRELKERLHVLERIATEKENSLARQIEELRDR